MTSAEIDAAGQTVFESFLRSRGWWFRPTTAKETQARLGDYCGGKAEKDPSFIELKSEKTDWGNIFLEVWSNRKRYTVGWMIYCESDILAYVVLDAKSLYMMRMPKLKEWFWHDDAYRRFELNDQKKNTQYNDTWAACVPIPVLKTLRKIGFKHFRYAEDSPPFSFSLAGTEQLQEATQG